MSKRSKEEADEHFTALSQHESHIKGEENGCVTRCVYKDLGGKWECQFTGHDYKKNGFDYQVSCGEADWYNLPIHEEGSEARKRFDAIFETPPKQPWRDPTTTPLTWYMGAGPYGYLNFVGSGHWPWANNAHHLIPVDDVLGDQTVLTLDERTLLQQVKYNVNKGINIIYLPNRTRHAELFQLLKHPRYHSTYSMDVRNRVKAIRDRLTKAADKEQEGHPQFTEETMGKLGEQLHAFSGRLRKQIRAAGIKSPGAHLNDLSKYVTVR